MQVRLGSRVSVAWLWFCTVHARVDVLCLRLYLALLCCAYLIGYGPYRIMTFGASAALSHHMQDHEAFLFRISSLCPFSLLHLLGLRLVLRCWSYEINQRASQHFIVTEFQHGKKRRRRRSPSGDANTRPQFSTRLYVGV